MDVEPLHEHLAELNRMRTIVARDLRKARCARARDRQRVAGSPSAWVERVALLVYMLSGWRLDAAAEWLTRKGRGKFYHRKPCEELAGIIEDWFLARDPLVIAAWADATAEHPKGWRARQAAERYVADWKLKEWVKVQNCSRGVAPSSAHLAQHRGTLLHQAQEDHQGAPATLSGETRSWAMRWRRKWGASHSKLRNREIVPAEKLREKAQQSD